MRLQSIFPLFSGSKINEMKYATFSPVIFASLIFSALFLSSVCYGQTRTEEFVDKAKVYGLNPKTFAEIKKMPVIIDSTHLFIWVYAGSCYPCRLAIKALEELRKDKAVKVTYILRLSIDQVGYAKSFLAATGLPIQDLVTQFFGVEEEAEMEGKKVINYPNVFIYKKGVYQGDIEGFASKEKFFASLKPHL